jgi:hypothetical protein
VKTQLEEFDFFNLDELRLDEEWNNQPKLVYEYGTKLADARADYERAKVDRDITIAEIEQDIRREPASFDIGKLTEGAVDAAVKLDPRYRTASSKLIDAKHDMDTLEAVVDGLDHRKWALQKRTDLWMAKYYAEPQPSNYSREHVTEAQKVRTSDRVKAKLNERRGKRNGNS